MKIKAAELKAGQIIRIEHGDSDNWKNVTIDEVIPFKRMVTAKCHCRSSNIDISFRPEELVEVTG